MQHFAVPQRPSLQTKRSLREKQYRVPRKRPHHDDEDLEDREHETGGDPLSEDEAALPPAPFPHGPAKSLRGSSGYAKVQKTLAAQDPPLFALEAASQAGPAGQEDASSLRQTHLNILMTIVHQCLLEGDYQRAGRAWGMLLRSSPGGYPFDPRFRGRWGISAELLLGQNPGGDLDQFDVERSDSYSEDAFALAKEYYERLIVQYPYQKSNPRGMNALMFYPAMFSLWLYGICEKSKRARQQIGDRDSTPDSVMGDRNVVEAAQIDVEELEQARAVAGRLDELIKAPPYDTHGGSLRLRGMVALWVADLISKEHFKDEEESDEEAEQKDFDRSPPHRRLDDYTSSRSQLEQALELFDRAQHHGENLTDAVGSVDLKIKELSRRIAKLVG